VTYAVAAVATPFRRRFPRATLALVLPVAMAALYLRAGGGAVIYVVMALYSVAAVSSRRAALIIVGLVASAVLAATIIGGGDQVTIGAIDIVAHAMSVIAVRSGVARMVIDTDPQQAREALAIIETTTRRSLREMRLLVSVLRDTGDHNAELAPVPGLSDLGLLIAGFGMPGSGCNRRGWAIRPECASEIRRWLPRFPVGGRRGGRGRCR
jgi:hypothetical protein